MFKLRRQEILDECRWTPQPGQLRYIEARTFANSKSEVTPATFQEGDLDDQDVDDWLHQRGRFAPVIDANLGAQESSVRLLACERIGISHLQFGLNKASFLSLEKTFDLPVETLPLFKANGGGLVHRFIPSHRHGTDPEQLAIAIKVPQMYQVGNYGLSMTHSFASRTTLGFVFGANLFNRENWKRSTAAERPPYLEPHLPRISDLIRSEILNWKEPLLLPVIFFEDHAYNMDRRRALDLSRRTTDVERRLGVTKAGRTVASTKSMDFEALSRMMVEDRFKIITDINSTITDVATFGSNMNWDHRYHQFLKVVSKDIESFSKSAPFHSSDLDTTIETLATFLASSSDHTAALKARLEIQLNVLYNLVAQLDSNTNSTIAATTGLDSVAMKALALITALFLPPTFIATLFSMSMFDWQADPTDSAPDGTEESVIVSKSFWIYWAVTLPLSTVLLLGWRAWWHREKNRYRRKYPYVKMDPDLGSRALKAIKKKWDRGRTQSQDTRGDREA